MLLYTLDNEKKIKDYFPLVSFAIGNVPLHNENIPISIKNYAIPCMIV